MKFLSAVRLRILLSVAMVALVALIVGVFLFGYSQMQQVGETASEHKTAALASENTINGLQRLKVELNTHSDTIEQLEQLRTARNLPQFDTEQSLRTIAGKLGLGVENITFVSEGEEATAAAPADPSSGTARGDSAAPAPRTAASTSAFWGGSRNSRISFEFTRALSYPELIRFLNAIETSTPKLRLDGISIPSGSSRESIELGTLILEIATS